MMLTPADVNAVRFAKPPFGKRGYDEEEVDTFLDTVAQTLTALHAEIAELRRAARDTAGYPSPTAHSPAMSSFEAPPMPAFGPSSAAENAVLAELDQIKLRLARIEAAVRR